MKKKFSERGFTLMELMVVIVIVAILAAVAVPLYINYVRDARRTEAKGAIAAAISAEQIYYQTNSKYSADSTQVHFDPGDAGRNWSFQISSADANGFTVQADGKTQNTNGLQVTCAYSRNADPIWTEK
jgi:type IV pilus assembly protein PilE